MMKTVRAHGGTSTSDQAPPRGRGRSRGQRGATLVEYALGVAFVCIGTLGGLHFLEDRASDDLNARADRSGAPDLAEATTDGGTTGGTSTGGTDGTDGSVPPTEVLFGGFSDERSIGSKTKPWTASIEALVTEVGGAKVSGARVEGVWTYDIGGVVTTVTAVCNQTTNQGICKFQLSDIPVEANTITFTLTDINGGVPPVVYNGPDVTSNVITKPT